MQSLKYYTDIQSNRLRFVMHFVFTKVLQCPLIVVDNITDADFSYGRKLCNYKANNYIKEGSTAKDAFFNEGKLYINKADFFDPISAIFYCLSRQEEYTAKVDQHGRFNPENSVFKDAIETPWVDVWIKNLATELNIEYNPKPAFLLTVDLDFGFRYLGKGAYRSVMGACRQVLNLDFGGVLRRVSSLIRNTDPYDDVYYWLKQKFSSDKLRFFALASNFSNYDKGLAPKTKAWKRLQHILKDYTVGLHPSYHHIENKEALANGKNILEANGFDVTSNRFHFLRMIIPTSYQNLIDINIKDDFSMGFADRAGFRAQTAQSFNYYDLENESITDLTLHPFVFMDAVCSIYNTQTSAQALITMQQMHQKVEETGGTFCLLWHEHTLQKGSETHKLLTQFLASKVAYVD